MIRFVARAEKGVGWRVWDRLVKRFWGPVFPRERRLVIIELNGAKRGSELARLVAAERRVMK